ncbi:conserved hypothetical protein [Coccidioides posadasii str. Silveira]|uniref:Protein kinase domain-containing protein n=2 Tax=Coccidioides posadasii TaxID=199306 RepID=E9CSJ0_COCPS|nr:conserved hypothetical protein [Coccidioides posadasii str. Silveira]KMM67555.1 hypothetical protein CPAG_03889 [Coccidioides posadasii RMSCC 3488]
MVQTILLSRTPSPPPPNYVGNGWRLQGLNGYHSETIEKYVHNFWCPIVVGDVLCGDNLLQPGQEPCSFRILGKLGFGAYSTVWLGWDTIFHRHLAIKNKRLYLCLGLNPLGSTLRGREYSELDPPSDSTTITTFIRTLFKKVEALHRNGICHGDLSAANVAFGVSQNALTPSAVQRTFSYGLKAYFVYIKPGEPPKRPQYLPEYIVQTINTALMSDMNDMTKVEILDFGNAFEGCSREGAKGTRAFLAPEMRDKTRCYASPKSDLWSLGCVFFYALTGADLFPSDKDAEGYRATASEGQLEKIDAALRRNYYLSSHPTYRRKVTLVIRSLLQIDPFKRSLEKTSRLIENLENDFHTNGGETIRSSQKNPM